MKKILILLFLLIPFIGISQTLTISGQHNQTYNGGAYTLIKVLNSHNITIKNFTGITGSTKTGINISNSDSITVVHCRLTTLKNGIYAVTSTHLKIDSNYITNVVGNASHCIQFDNSSGEIVRDSCVNDTGQHINDIINVYESNGTSTIPILIKKNYIYGGGPSNGSGIQVDTACSYVKIDSNTVINPGTVGISTYFDNNILVTNNHVCSQFFRWAQIGLFYDQSTSITTTGNVVYWIYTNRIAPPNNTFDFWDDVTGALTLPPGNTDPGDCPPFF